MSGHSRRSSSGGDFLLMSKVTRKGVLGKELAVEDFPASAMRHPVRQATERFLITLIGEEGHQKEREFGAARKCSNPADVTLLLSGSSESGAGHVGGGVSKWKEVRATGAIPNDDDRKIVKEREVPNRWGGRGAKQIGIPILLFQQTTGSLSTVRRKQQQDHHAMPQ
eukprot:scaffold389_cov211-Alexandrium_tamarense.AAC.4